MSVSDGESPLYQAADMEVIVTRVKIPSETPDKSIRAAERSTASGIGNTDKSPLTIILENQELFSLVASECPVRTV